jgi:hypothetical protein
LGLSGGEVGVNVGGGVVEIEGRFEQDDHLAMLLEL